jgi:hypothetical protein
MKRAFAAWLACASIGCAQQPSKDDLQMACVERLEVPSFPSIADSARVEAGLNAMVLLTTDGAVEKVSMQVTSGMEYAGKLFFPTVEKAMKASKFLPSCAGTTVHLAFDFPFPTRSETGETVQTVRFRHPNRFEIALTPGPARVFTFPPFPQ